MKLNRYGLIGLAFAAFIGFTIFGQTAWHLHPTVAQAEPPIVTPSALPASPATPPTVTPSVRPTVKASPAPSATIVPAIPTLPLTPISPVPVVPTAPASIAPPLPVSSDYKDPNGRFKIAILKDYAVSPLAGSALIESRDGSLAYTVLVRSQGELALQNGTTTFINDALAKIAQTAFQQGEGFQTAQWQAIPGGIKMDWTGSLTIAGKSQPMSGVILVRQLPTDVAMILIAATQSAVEQVPGAVSALVDSLQPL
ncbi:MAG: hypothetical protein LH660_01040 [Phormidesmis sp. CAN_BIN36]|nr:hypothetical protein [Phormidesmis sp. CAN_BIN36]